MKTRLLRVLQITAFVLGCYVTGAIAADFVTNLGTSSGTVNYVATDRVGFETWNTLRANFLALNAFVKTGAGSPEGSVTGGVGAIYRQTDGTDGTSLWTKVSGTGNTGWASLATSTSVCTVNSWCRTTATLTDSQIKALPSTKVTLVAAPGVNKWIHVHSVTYTADCAAGAYTNIDTDYADVTLQMATPSFLYVGGYVSDDPTTTPATTNFTSLFGTANKRMLSAVQYLESVGAGGVGYVSWGNAGATTSYTNLALQIGMSNDDSGDLTGGNAANSLTVTVYYSVEDIP